MIFLVVNGHMAIHFKQQIFAIMCNKTIIVGPSHKFIEYDSNLFDCLSYMCNYLCVHSCT